MFILFIFVIIILLITTIYLINLLYIKSKLYNNLKKEYIFKENEAKQFKQQFEIYEKLEKNKRTVSINNKMIKKNMVYNGYHALIGDYYEGSSANTIQILKSYGLSVDIVRTGKDIVDRITNGYNYDIIFTNNIYKLGFDGPTTLNKLKEIKNFNIPVVMHTVSENQRGYFINTCGFDEYVTKPITQEKIKPILDKFFGSR